MANEARLLGGIEVEAWFIEMFVVYFYSLILFEYMINHILVYKSRSFTSKWVEE